MKNLNQLIKMPVLKYSLDLDFENRQIEKLFEEIEEFRQEKDCRRTEKACELLDLLQVSLSFLELFSVDEIDQAYRLNLEKHKDRQEFEIIGKYEIFKIMHKK
jgi:predicted house-cleaning noncanonical NTP pyrophosphatase (MazG superfamily)